MDVADENIDAPAGEKQQEHRLAEDFAALRAGDRSDRTTEARCKPSVARRALASRSLSPEEESVTMLGVAP